jgi:hypothetical protein
MYGNQGSQGVIQSTSRTITSEQRVTGGISEAEHSKLQAELNRIKSELTRSREEVTRL